MSSWPCRAAHGRWLLTGSQQFQLMANVGESLAGRIALLDLLPFSLLELPATGERTLASLLWRGSYPEPALQPEKRDLWISSYVQTYVERDVRQLLKVQDLRTLKRPVSRIAALMPWSFRASRRRTSSKHAEIGQPPPPPGCSRTSRKPRLNPLSAGAWV